MGTVEVALQRIETKLDDLRDHLHSVELGTAAIVVKQATIEKELEHTREELATLKTAHDRAVGVVKLLALPGVIAALAAGFKWFGP